MQDLRPSTDLARFGAGRARALDARCGALPRSAAEVVGKPSNLVVDTTAGEWHGEDAGASGHTVDGSVPVTPSIGTPGHLPRVRRM